MPVSIRLPVIAVLFALFAMPSFAADTVNVDEDGIILGGYDAVAYFTEGKPVEGKSRFTHSWNGAVYRFANADNLEMFKADPERYAPAYGGYCSYGVRVGKKLAMDPTAWEVVDDRLFVQLDRGTRTLWLEERDKNIAIGDRIWPSIRNTPKDKL
jgi:YHS domain-containing protein